MGVKVVQNTSELKVGDILECPHGVIELVTRIINDQQYQSTMLHSLGDVPENHINCPKRIVCTITPEKDDEVG